VRYRGTLTVPAGTTAAEPATAELICCPGLLSEIEVYFPPGSAGRVYGQVRYHDYGQVRYHERIVFPSSPDMSFRGDDTLLTFNERFPLTETPYTLTLVGWAPTATYDHAFFVSISIMPWTAYAALAYPDMGEILEG